MTPLLHPLHRAPRHLPEACTVLVVGAGPAGSSCAHALAREGVDVVLVDQHTFPRDKVCGDALIPDAHRAMQRLGVLRAVMAHAHAADMLGCIGPRGTRVDVPGTLAVLPRRVLDHVLCEAATHAGARLFTPLRFEGLIEDGAGRAVGARLRDGGVVREIRCEAVVLATGAAPQALIAARMVERQSASGVALRGYLRNDAMTDRLRALDVVWHQDLAPGYGWIFPCGGGVFNVGAGVLTDDKPDQRDQSAPNLREVFDAFARVYEPARELVEGGHWLGAPKGAPLRCSLAGARWTRAGLLVTGEAAGSTYAFTGEGIGKAMETGLLAATALLESRDAQSAIDEAAARSQYELGLAALKPRFALYDKANALNRHPWIADWLLRRVQKSPRLMKRMSGVLEETSNPGNLLSMRGVMRVMFE